MKVWVNVHVKDPTGGNDDYFLLLRACAELELKALTLEEVEAFFSRAGGELEGIMAVEIFANDTMSKSLFFTTVDWIKRGLKPLQTSLKYKTVKVVEEENEIKLYVEAEDLSLKAFVRNPLLPGLSQDAYCFLEFDFTFYGEQSGNSDEKYSVLKFQVAAYSKRRSGLFIIRKPGRVIKISELLDPKKQPIAESKFNDNNNDLSGENPFILRVFGIRDAELIMKDNYWQLWFSSLSEANSKEQYSLHFKYLGLKDNRWLKGDYPSEPRWSLKPFEIPIGRFGADEYIDNFRDSDGIEIRGYITKHFPPDLEIIQREWDEEKGQNWEFRSCFLYRPKKDMKVEQLQLPLTVWNRCVEEPTYLSLERVKEGQSGSVIPKFSEKTKFEEIEFQNSVQYWQSTYTLIDSKPHEGVIKKDHFEEPTLSHIHPLNINKENIPPALKIAHTVSGEMRNFVTHQGQKTPLSRIYTIKEPNSYILNKLKYKSFKTPRFLFDWKDTSSREEPKEINNVRVGALDLGFIKPILERRNDELDGEFRNVFVILDSVFSSKKNLDVEAIKNTPRPRPIVVDMTVELRVDSIEGGGQDRLISEIQSEQTPDRILLPVKKGESKVKGKFILRVFEDNKRYANQNIKKMVLVRATGSTNTSTSPGLVDYIVLDQSPFLISRVKADIQLGANQQIGYWGGEGHDKSWKLRETEDGFRLILPPQVVGEEFIKDYEDSYPDHTQALQFKFSTPSIFRLARTIFKQKFSDVPWDLTRLLGRAGEEYPGLGIFMLEFELLYGLTTTIKGDFIQLPNRREFQLRLAEIQARMGLLPRLLKSDQRPLALKNGSSNVLDKKLIQIFSEYNSVFEKQLKLIWRRLALLEPWSPQQQTPILSLDTNVQYRFRKTREVEHPFEDWQNDGPYRRFDPKPDEIPSSKISWGLRGGVDFGFESKNIYESVINSGSSSSGAIVGPTFTALGGNGFQKASFDNDRSTIYSNTSLGRTYTYTLERIGRICGFWNRAKHVIVYERSVVSSKQFSDPPKDPKDPDYKEARWDGRPVVRKVEEYIELIQEVRTYPDFEDHDPRNCGPCKAINFVDKKILVDSSWGQDIEDGWVIKLYEPTADPEIYRPPSIYVDQATSEETGKEHVWALIKNPENLLFYTSTKKSDGAKTDEWNPVADYDFPLINIPSRPDWMATHVDGAPDSLLPDPPSVERGYERFTLWIDSFGQTSNLLNNRLDETAETVLDNIVMVRRSLETIDLESVTDKLENQYGTKAKEAREKIDEIITKSQKEVSNAEEKLAEVLSIASGKIKEIKAKIKKFADNLDDSADDFEEKYAKLSKEYESFSKDPEKFLENQQKHLEQLWNNALDETSKNIIKRFREEFVGGVVNRAESEIEAVINMARIELERQLRAPTSVLTDLRVKIEQTAAFVERLKTECCELTNKLKEDLKNNIKWIEERAKEAINQSNEELYKSVHGKAIKDMAFLVSKIAMFQRVVIRAKKGLGELFPDQLTKVQNMLDTIVNYLKIYNFFYELNTNNTKAEIEEKANQLREEIDKESNFSQICNKLDLVGKNIRLHGLKIQAIESELHEQIDLGIQELKDFVRQWIQTAKLGLDKLEEAFLGKTNKLKNDILAKYFKKAGEELKKFFKGNKEIFGEIEDIAGRDGIAKRAKKQVLSVTNLVKDVADQLKGTGDSITKEAQEAFRELTYSALEQGRDVLEPYQRQIQNFARSIDTDVIAQSVDEISKYADRSLRLASAFGRALDAEALKHTRERVQYYFNQLDSVLQTPVSALVNRFDRELENLDIKTLGIRWPSGGVGKKMLPLLKGQLDFRDILPDFAGMDLSALLGGSLFEGTKGVDITHGVNPSTRLAWAQCVIDKPLEKAELFNFGIVSVEMENSHFDAFTRVEYDGSGSPRRDVKAELKADWHLIIGGQRILTLKESVLKFDGSGNLKFKMKPESIVLNEALQFINDIAQIYKPPSGSGLTFELLTLDSGIPIGARATLDLPIPPIQAGAFSMAGILLNAFFEVAVDPAEGGFYLGTGMGVNSKDRPFTMNILCLGGGGWIVTKALYYPFKQGNKLEAMLSIGIAAGASIPFDIGIASGGVYMLVSVGVEFEHGGGTSDLEIILRIAVSGEVVVLGLISIGILLALEAAYHSNGSLEGRGILRVKIKIGWFIKIDVEKEFTTVLAGSGGGGGGPGMVKRNEAAFLTSPLVITESDTTDNIKQAIDDYYGSFGD